MFLLYILYHCHNSLWNTKLTVSTEFSRIYTKWVQEHLERVSTVCVCFCSRCCRHTNELRAERRGATCVSHGKHDWLSDRSLWPDSAGWHVLRRGPFLQPSQLVRSLHQEPRHQSLDRRPRQSLVWRARHQTVPAASGPVRPAGPCQRGKLWPHLQHCLVVLSGTLSNVSDVMHARLATVIRKKCVGIGHCVVTPGEK